MKKLTLTDEIINKICALVELRLKWKEIAHAIGVTPRTLQLWRREGGRAKSGIKHKLVRSIEKAQADLTHDLSKVVIDEALNGNQTITTKLRKDNAGNIIGTDTTIKKTFSNPKLALKILALMHPDRWAETKHIKYEWKESLANMGLDPKKIEDGFFKELEENADPLALPAPTQK